MPKSKLKTKRFADSYRAPRRNAMHGRKPTGNTWPRLTRVAFHYFGRKPKSAGRVGWHLSSWFKRGKRSAEKDLQKKIDKKDAQK